MSELCAYCVAEAQEREDNVKKRQEALPPRPEPEVPADPEDDKSALAQQLLANRVLQRRRLLPFVEASKPNYMAGWVHKDICRRLERFEQDIIEQKSPRLMLFLPPRHGKAVENIEKILTANRGWTTHGDLRPGDYVFHPSGKPVRVLAETPEVLVDYIIETSDGARIQCHGDHEWTIYDRTTKTTRTVETKWLMTTTKFGVQRKLDTGPPGKRGHRYKFQIDRPAALQFPEADLPLHPYFLGAWLGDGTSSDDTIVCSPLDREPIDAIIAAGFTVSSRHIHKDTGVHKYGFSHQGVRAALRDIGVLNNKHIPEMYLRASEAQRLDLLAGLIDTDGHVEARTGRVRIATASKQLADGVVELTRGLGYAPYVVEQQPVLSTSGIQGRKIVYYVGFQPTGPVPTKIPRKAITVFAPQKRIAITAVYKAETPALGKCIQVDSPDGLYLVGEHLTPTHNSQIASIDFPAWFLGRNPTMEVIACSYSASLAMGFSRKVRTLLRSPEYAAVFPNTQLDPDVQAAEGWQTTLGGGYVPAGVSGPITGKGAHCAYFACQVTTKNGMKPITDICVGDQVLGYDHVRQQPVWTRVRAVSTQHKPDDFVSVQGAILTPEHKVWTGDGYTDVLEVLDRVQAAKNRGPTQLSEVRAGYEVLLQQSVCGENNELEEMQLREAEIMGGAGVPELPLGGQAGRTDVPAVQYKVQAHVLRGKEIRRVRAPRNLLFTSLLRFISGGESAADGKKRAVRSLRNAPSRQTKEVLFQKVLSYAQGFISRIFRGLVSTAPSCKTARKWFMRALRTQTGKKYSASHRSRRGEQCAGKLDPVMRAVPQPLSSTNIGTSATDLAGLLPRARRGYVRVVDIQTETGNFFCGQVLVHNCLIIDDPVKNREEAESANTQEVNYDWYTSTAYTRLAPGGGLLVIMTRWHDMDLAGRLLQAEKEGGDKWEVVCYPAIATEDEKFRAAGEALHPERYPIEALMRIRNAVGPRDWEALYQQNPVSNDGDYFQRSDMRFYQLEELKDKQLQYYAAWDFAVGKKEMNDYSAAVVVGIDREDNIYVVDVWRGRWAANELVEKILDLYEKWKPSIVGLERGVIEMSIGPFLDKRIAERRLWEIYIEELKPGRRDKVARARAIQGRLQQGKVFFPADGHFTHTLITEMLRFPSGEHDDQVDALAWVGHMLSVFHGLKEPKEEKKKSWRDKLKVMSRKEKNAKVKKGAMAA